MDLNLMVASWSYFPPRSRLLPIDEYLETEIGYQITLNTKVAQSYSPKQIIQWVANKDGVSHLDFRKPAIFKSLKSWNWHSQGKVYNDGLIRKIILQIGKWTYHAIEKVLNPFGDISIVIKLRLKALPKNTILLGRFIDQHNAVVIICSSLPIGIEFKIVENDKIVQELIIKYPDEWRENTDSVFCLTYSSISNQIQVILNGDLVKSVNCPLGIVRSEDIIGNLTKGYEENFKGNIALFGKIIKSSELNEILSLPLDWLEALKQNEETNKTV